MARTVPAPCLGARRSDGVWDPCGVAVVGGTCDRHRAMREANRRPTSSRRGYDAGYRRERDKILPKGARVPCELRLPGCTHWATTLHHTVPVDGGRNVAAARMAPKIPSCSHCNESLGNKRTLRK